MTLPLPPDLQQFAIENDGPVKIILEREKESS
jgi:hypothetical protein